MMKWKEQPNGDCACPARRWDRASTNSWRNKRPISSPFSANEQIAGMSPFDTKRPFYVDYTFVSALFCHRGVERRVGALGFALHHAQAPALLNHSRPLPQGDGDAGP